MPIYEYRCRACGSQSEILVFPSRPEVSCPSCGSGELDKLMSPTAHVAASASGLPGPKDTGCCGSAPGTAHGCAGPGSCCGKAG